MITNREKLKLRHATPKQSVPTDQLMLAWALEKVVGTLPEEDNDQMEELLSRNSPKISQSREKENDKSLCKCEL